VVERDRGARDPFVKVTRGASPWLYVRVVAVPRKTGAYVPCPVDDGAIVGVVAVVVTAIGLPTGTEVTVAIGAAPRALVEAGAVTVAAALGGALAGDVTVAVALGTAIVAVALGAAGAGPASGRIVTACQAYWSTKDQLNSTQPCCPHPVPHWFSTHTPLAS